VSVRARPNNGLSPDNPDTAGSGNPKVVGAEVTLLSVRVVRAQTIIRTRACVGLGKAQSTGTLLAAPLTH